MRVRFEGKLVAKFVDVRLGWAWVTGTTAFHATVLIEVLYFRPASLPHYIYKLNVDKYPRGLLSVYQL
jgi:hypothetical protein